MNNIQYRITDSFDSEITKVWMEDREPVPQYEYFNTWDEAKTFLLARTRKQVKLIEQFKEFEVE